MQVSLDQVRSAAGGQHLPNQPTGFVAWDARDQLYAALEMSILTLRGRSSVGLGCYDS
jgi:hypothetical protein